MRQKSPSAHLIPDSPILGCHAHIFPTGIGTTSYLADDVTIFAGSRQKLYSVTLAGVETDLSRGGGYAAAGEPGAWRFASFGNDVWAVNCLDAAQRRTANTGSFANGITSTFKPIGRFIGPVREFMVIASLANAGRSADEFCWSDANDATWYDDLTGTRPASVAGSKALRSRPGQITGFVPGDYGVLFKRRSAHVLQFSGGSDVFRLDEISRGVGVALPSSLIVGRFANYFFGGDGFYRQVGMGPPEKVSPASIDALFIDSIHYGTKGFYHGAMTAMSQEDNLMFGFEDWNTGLIFWFYTAGYKEFPVSTPLDAGVCYDPASGMWSRASGPDTQLGLNLYRGIAYPQNATEITSAETVRVVLFDDDGSSNSRLCTLSGSHEAASLTTKRRLLSFDSLSPSGRYKINGVLPIFTTPETTIFSTQPPDPRTATQVPVTITVQTANEPTMIEQLDADAGIVSPRSQAEVIANANDWGWFGYSIEGRAMDVTVAFAAGAEWRNFEGVWLSGEPVG